jgi:general secretion pathway protein H
MDRRRAGFTLIEMIVVLAVLGLAAMLVVGRVSGHSQGLEARAQALRIADTLRLARARAIAGDRPVAVALSADRRRMVMAGGSVDETVAPFPLLVSAPGGAASIVFVPDGSATGGRIVVSAPGAAWHVDVAAHTGRVAVSRAP